jgi:hypothetical protein
MKIANSENLKIPSQKIFQINFLGSHLNSHGIFIFLLIKYHGRLKVYHRPLGILCPWNFTIISIIAHDGVLTGKCPQFPGPIPSGSFT